MQELLAELITWCENAKEYTKGSNSETHEAVRAMVSDIEEALKMFDDDGYLYTDTEEEYDDSTEVDDDEEDEEEYED